jgi:hypothetical protein
MNFTSKKKTFKNNFFNIVTTIEIKIHKAKAIINSSLKKNIELLPNKTNKPTQKILKKYNITNKYIGISKQAYITTK